MFSRLFAKGYCTNLRFTFYTRRVSLLALLRRPRPMAMCHFLLRNTQLNQQMRGRFLYIQFSNAINHMGDHTYVMSRSIGVLYVWPEALWYLSLLYLYTTVLPCTNCTAQVIWIGRTTERKESFFLCHAKFQYTYFTTATHSSSSAIGYISEGARGEKFKAIYIWSHGWWESLTNDYISTVVTRRYIHNIVGVICMAYYPSQETMRSLLN